jgi:hypothetical protein
MSASTGQKVAVVIAFILLGVPTGLCSILSTPFIIAGFLEVVKGRGLEVFVLNLSFAAVWLVGLAISSVLILQLRVTFRDKPSDPTGDDQGTSP